MNSFRYVLLCAAAALLVSLYPATSTHASGGPESVAVVVNADSWASTRIANEYIHLRKIPPSNVVYLSGIDNFERLSAENFRQRILLPVLTTLEKRGLQGQIDCVAYSSDLPTSIDASDDAKGVTLPPTLSPIVSSNGATYLYKLFLGKDIRYVSLNNNFYASRVMSHSQDSMWTPDEQSRNGAALKTLMSIADERKKQKEQFDEAAATQKTSEVLAVFLELKKTHPNSDQLLYNIACCQALVGKSDDAITSLAEAFKNGWSDVTHTRGDEDLVTLRDRQDFKELMAKMATVRFETTPPKGFTAKIAWTPTGFPAQNPAMGVPYMLSTMLACTSGRGNSVREALTALRRAVGADGSRPKGTVYFERNGDVRSTTREWGFESACERLRKLGVDAVVEDGVLPKGKPDVIGAMVGSAGFSWSESGSTILPGAICEHLTSCGGMMGENDGQTPLSEFIRFGAAGTAGAVTEPYALQAKFPSPFIHTHYADGCSLAESFYLSLAGPYQLLIVGDPLCRPWPRVISFILADPQIKESLAGTISAKPVLDPSTPYRPSAYEFFVDGALAGLIAPGNAWAFDTAKLADGPHELTVVAVSADLLAHGRLTVPFSTKNTTQKELAATASAKEIAWNTPLEIKAKLEGAKEIALVHNARLIAKINGAEGAASIDPKILGEGPARIYPFAVFGTDTEELKVVGAPINVNVIPPSPLPPLKGIDFAALTPGLAVRANGKSKIVVEKAEGDWLEKAGVADGTDFEVGGHFVVPDDEVYQFQLRGEAVIESLAVDGVVQSWPGNGPWRFIPVNLTKGVHALTLKGKGKGKSSLDIRFGGPGSRRLDAKRFKN